MLFRMGNQMFCTFVKLFSILSCVILLNLTWSVYASADWDVLIFTQRWPITACLEWEEEKEHNTCTLQSDNSWTIHGIWPTKLGHVGPGFCNNSLHFDIQQLKPIENDLLRYWPDIHNGTKDGLWKHEWKKHGTCAAVLETLNSEYKYFSQGLEWIHMYAMEDVLATAGISPDVNGYTPQQVWDAVRGRLEKDPDVQCIQDKKTKKWYLSEIRICFDKTLKLVDCDGIKDNIESSENKIISNCPLSQDLLYPAHMPTDQETSVDPKPYRATWLLQFLQIIQWIQWITL